MGESGLKKVGMKNGGKRKKYMARNPQKDRDSSIPTKAEAFCFKKYILRTIEK